MRNGSNYLLVEKCENYLGTPYKYGGEDKKGMDCSGLIYAVFNDLGQQIPRVSYQQAEYFRTVSDIKIGDLVYFKVNSNRINHTGVVSAIKGRQEILFIHASVSKGVREDNLYSDYWHPKFIKATRPRL
jgi:probable lipoprotein NlpC